MLSQQRAAGMVQGILDRLGDSGTIDALVGEASQEVGFPIWVKPMTESVPVSVTGLCESREDGYVVSVRQDLPQWLSNVVVAHELGHILLGHLVPPGVEPPIARRVDALLPDLQDAQRAWRLYRCDLQPLSDEADAELLGSMLISASESGGAAASRTPVARRFARLLAPR